AWVASLAITARGQWAQPADPSLPSEWVCVALIVVSGVPLLLVIARMLRRGAPLNPSLTAALRALAVTGFANVGACVPHPHPDNAMTLVWDGATIGGAMIASAVAGPFVLKWTRGR